MKLSKSVQEELYNLLTLREEREEYQAKNEYKTAAEKRAINIYQSIKANPVFNLLTWNDSKDIINVLNEEYTDNSIAILFTLYNYSNKTGFKSFTLADFISNNKHLGFAYDLKPIIQGLAWDFPKMLHVEFNKDLDNIYLKDGKYI